jgi:hypothetical protein
VDSDTEGLFLFSTCLGLGLLAHLQDRGLIDRGQIQEITDRAELTLAQLSPALTSPEARDYARRVLKALLDTYQAAPAAKPPDGSGGAG